MAGWVIAWVLLLLPILSCGTPATPPSSTTTQTVDTPSPGRICTWIANQFVNWDPSVLSQIEGKDLPACTGGCGAQPAIYGCNTAECRFYFSRCKRSNLLDDLATWIARIETVNGMIAGNDNSGRGRVVHQVAQRLWDALHGACVGWIVADASSHPNKIYSVPPNSQQVYGRNMTPALADRMCTSWTTIVEAAGYAGVSLQAIQQCLMPTAQLITEILRVLQDQFQYNGGCYGYLNQEWWVETGRMICELVNTVNKCRTTQALSSALASVNAYINTNPILQTLILGCDTFTECQQNILCENVEKACKFQHYVAARPIDCMTAGQNYSCDLSCCCRKNGVWSVGPEHQCLDQGGFMRPGTCGVADPTQRTAWHLPTTPAQCEQFDNNPAAWGPVGDPALTCVARCQCPTLTETPPAGLTCATGLCPTHVTYGTGSGSGSGSGSGYGSDGGTGSGSSYGSDGGYVVMNAVAGPGSGSGSGDFWNCTPPPCQLFGDGTGQQDCGGCGTWCSANQADDYCGNSLCGYNETSSTCPAECPVLSNCGDGVCSPGEDQVNCPGDCPTIPTTDICGDGFCGMSENNLGCPQDCPTVPDLNEYGDGVCGDGETCAADCPAVAGYCSDGICDGGSGENCTTCPNDCGECP